MGNELILTKEKYIKQIMAMKTGAESACFFNFMADGYIKGGDEIICKSNKESLWSTVEPASEVWQNSSGQQKLMGEIESLLKKVKNRYEKRSNISQFPDDYYDLINKIRIDITRRRMETIDLTGIITDERINFNFSKSVDLTEFLPYAGRFKEMHFTGDTVPLLQQKTGAIGAISMKAYGLGHGRTLEDELYNLDIFQLIKVNDAVARAYVNERNNLIVGGMLAITAATGWTAEQHQDAIVALASFDLNMYRTLQLARKKLLALKDPQTGQDIKPTQIYLIVGNLARAENVNDVIRGQLNGYATPAQNLQPLGIDQVIIYDGDTVTVGKDQEVFAGVDEDKAYMFVPSSGGSTAITAVKRPLFMEMGRGDIWQFVRDKRSWGFVQQNYMTEFYGSSDLSGVITDTGRGYIVEIDLPADEETT